MMIKYRYVLVFIMLCALSNVFCVRKTWKVMNRSVVLPTPPRMSASSYHSRPASSERSGCFIDKVGDLLDTYDKRIETYEKICKSLGDHGELKKYFELAKGVGKLQGKIHQKKKYELEDDDKEEIGVLTLTQSDNAMHIIQAIVLRDSAVKKLPIFFQERSITLMYLKYAYAYLKEVYSKAPKDACIDVDAKVLSLLSYLYYDINEELSEIVPKEIVDKKVVINPKGFNYGGYALAFWVYEDNSVINEPVRLFNGFKKNDNVFSLTMEFGTKFTLSYGNKTEVINTLPKCSQLTYVMVAIEKNCDDFKVKLILRQGYSNERYEAKVDVPGSVIENLEIVLGDSFIDPHFYTHFKYSDADEFRIFGKLAEKKEKAIMKVVDKCRKEIDNCIYQSLQHLCQACDKEFVVNDGKCSKGCSPGTIQNDKGECDACTPECAKCLDATSCEKCKDDMFLLHGKCVDSCPSNMFQDANKTCSVCDKNCSVCESLIKCSKCLPPFKLHKGKCVETCPKGTNFNSLDNKCHDCPNKCAACSSDTECTECSEDLLLSPKKQCISTCETGTYPDALNKTCDKCLEHCASCNNSTQCIICSEGFKLSDDKNCQLTCKPGQAQLKDICIDCHNQTTCVECNPTNVKQCLKCLPPAVLKDNVCVTDCGDGFFKDTETNICLPCTEGCEVCQSSASCETCVKPKALLDGKCVEFCPEGFALNDSQCDKCANEDCRQCAADLETCTKCFKPKLLKEGKCIDDCGSESFANKDECKHCLPGCQECTDQYSCDKCNEDKVLNGFLCVAECPIGSRANSVNACEKCTEEGCKTCEKDKTICTACQGNKVLHNNECLTSCPEGTFIKEGSDVCEDCSEHCQLCNDEKVCMRCSPGFVLQGEVCQEKCNDSYYSWFNVCAKCPGVNCKTCNENASKCDSCIEGKTLVDGQCEEGCKEGTHLKNGVCLPCQSPCKTCTDKQECLSCVTDYTLEGKNCTTKCTEGQVFANGDCKDCLNPLCKVCETDLKKCLIPKEDKVIEDGVAKDNCSDHHYLDGFNCLDCSENCYKCENGKKCDLCLPGFYLKNDKCVKDCGDNYVVTDSTCAKCDTECKSCKADDVTHCTECYDKNIFDGRCIKDCPKGTYEDDNTCKPCNDPNCAECGKEGKKCDKCKLGTALWEDKCIALCPVGTKLENGQCLACIVPNCANCDINLNQCAFCKDDSVLVSPNQCAPTCPIETYSKEMESSPGVFYCKDCPRNCEKCNDKECLKCDEPFVLQNSTCVSVCDAGSFNNEGKCKKCKEEHCDKCNKDACLSCEKPFLLQDNKCVENCTDKQFKDTTGKCLDCSKDCLTCSDALNCTKCDEGLKLLNGQCADDCGEGQVADDKGTCIMCKTSPKCLRCSKTDLGECLECKAASLLLNNDCVEDCGKGKFPEGKTCLSCLPKCFSCDNGNECIQCDEGTVLSKNQCLSQCPLGAYQQAGTCIECPIGCSKCTNQECTQCSPGKLLEEGKCVNVCSPANYKKNELECAKCTDNCLICNGPKECSICSPGLVIASDGSCTPNCSEREVNLNGKCEKCEASCLKCSALNKCEQCDDKTVLFKDKCEEKCPPGTYANEKHCLPCLPNCSLCADAKTCDLCVPPLVPIPVEHKCEPERECESKVNPVVNVCGHCQKGFTEVNGVCEKCKPENCAECKGNLSQCQKCDEGYLHHKGQCVNFCPESTFKPVGSTECKDCAKECLVCSNEKVCVTCKPGFNLQNEKCVNSCPDGSMDNTGECVTCQVKDCKICNSDVTDCDKCQEGLLLLNKKNETSCVTTCGESFYEKEQTCLPCSEPDCLTCPNNVCTSCTPETALQGTHCKDTCDKGWTERNNVCFKCTDIYCAVCEPINLNKCEKCIKPFVLKNHKCRTQCDKNYFPKDFKTHIECLKCPENCKKCDDHKCKECEDDFVMKEGKCVASCDEGYVLNGNVCEKCATEHCIKCFPNGLKGCTKCGDGLVLDKKEKCVKECGPGETSKDGICIDCGEACVSCKADGKCIQCQADKFLFEGVCVNSCDAHYSPDSINECKPCDNKSCNTCNLETQKCTSCPKGTKLNQGDCVEKCPEGTFTNGDHCQPCPNNCQVCSNDKQCQKCISPFIITEGLCQDNCPKFEVNINGTCTKCVDAVNCYQCAKEDVQKCLDCKEGTHLFNATCVAECPDETFPSNGKCLPCLDNCKDCNSATTCSECKDGFHKNNNMCVAECPKGTSEVNKECLPCKDPSCEQCSGNVTQCEKCREPTFPDEGKCILSCGVGKYNDKTEKKCLPCIEGCLACTNNSTCTQCNNSLVITKDGDCKDHCEEGQFVNPPDSKCTNCDNLHCSTCEPTNSASCITCPSSLLKHLQPNGEFHCIVRCPDSYYPDLEKQACIQCKPPCLKCQNDTLCQSCIPPLLLNDGNCTSKCDIGEVERNRICLKCAEENCDLCDVNNLRKCLKCEKPFALFKDECYEICPEKYYNNTETFKCEECSPTCATCDNAKTCLTCTEDHFFVANSTQCAKCLPPNIIINETCTTCLVEHCKECYSTNEEKCNVCKEPFILFNDTCLSQCPNGTFQEGPNCVECIDGCEKCTNLKTCILCEKGKVNAFGKCFDECPEGMRQNGDVCEKCASHSCVSCPSATDKCQNCKGQLLYKGECINACPSKTMVSDNECIECQKDCSVCSPQGCTTCAPNKLLKEKECVDSCGAGYYQFAESCLKCKDPLCDQCTAQKCEKCKEEAKLQPLDYSSCATTCPQGYFLEKDSDKCEKCALGCAECTKESCLTCLPNFAKFNETCLETCPENMGFIKGECVKCDQAQCKKCAYDHPEVCEECTNKNDKGFCVDECPKGTFNQNETCVACDIKCEDCISATECIKCKPTFILKDKQCLNTCGDGQVKAGNLCLPCEDEKCLECSENTRDCYKCEAPKLLHKGDCIDACPNKTFTDKESNSCKECKPKCSECVDANSCLKCKRGYYMDLEGECVEHCGEGTYEACDNEARKCKPCNKACKTCFSDLKTDCLACAEGYISHKEQCILTTECPSGTFFDKDRCSKCLVPYCKSCPNKATCAVCSRGFSLNDDKKCEVARTITPVIKDFVLASPYTFNTPDLRQAEIFPVSSYKGTGVGSDSFTMSFYLRLLGPVFDKEVTIVSLETAKQDVYTYSFIIDTESICRLRVFDREKNIKTLEIGKCSYDNLYDWKFYSISIKKMRGDFKIVVNTVISDTEVRKEKTEVPTNGRNAIVLDTSNITINGNAHTALTIGKLNIMDYIPNEEQLIVLSKHMPSNCDYFCLNCKSVCLACPEEFTPVNGKCQSYYVQAKIEASLVSQSQSNTTSFVQLAQNEPNFFPKGDPQSIHLVELNSILVNDNYGFTAWFNLENMSRGEKAFLAQVSFEKSYDAEIYLSVYVLNARLYVGEKVIKEVEKHKWYFISITYEKANLIVQLQDKQGLNETKTFNDIIFIRIYNSFIYKVGANFLGCIYNYKLYLNNAQTGKDIANDFSKLECSGECRLCSDVGVKCRPGLVLENGQCIEAVICPAECKSCVAHTTKCKECPERFTLKNDKCEKVACPEGCSACDEKTGECVDCPGGFDYENGRCPAVCPKECKLCVKDSTKCQECNEGFVLKEDKCIKPIEPVVCPKECASCVEGTTGCKECPEGFTLEQGKCLVTCPKECKSCIENTTKCLECPDGFTLKEDKCVQTIACPTECKTCVENSVECKDCPDTFLLQNGKCIEDETAFIQLVNLKDIWNLQAKRYQLPVYDSMTISFSIRKKKHSYIHKQFTKASLVSLLTEGNTTTPIIQQELMTDYSLKLLLDAEKQISFTKNYDDEQFGFFNVLIFIDKSSINTICLDYSTGEQLAFNQTLDKPITHIEIGDKAGYELNMEFSNMRVHKGIVNDTLMKTLQATPFNLQGTCSKYNFDTKKCNICLGVEQKEEKEDCNCGLFGFHHTYIYNERSYASIASKESQFRNVIYDTQAVNINRDEYSLMMSFKFLDVTKGKYRIGCYSNDYLRKFKHSSSRGTNIICLEAEFTRKDGITLLITVNDNNGETIIIPVSGLSFKKGQLIRGLISINTSTKTLSFGFVLNDDVNAKYTGTYTFKVRPERLQASGGLKLFGINDGLDPKQYKVPFVFIYDFSIMSTYSWSDQTFEWLLRNPLAIKPEPVCEGKCSLCIYGEKEPICLKK